MSTSGGGSGLKSARLDIATVSRGLSSERMMALFCRRVFSLAAHLPFGYLARKTTAGLFTMYETRAQLTLKDGERVECGVVTGPDDAWAQHLEPLLGHKGGFWNWQNSQALRTHSGLDARFHILHRAGAPFANVSIFSSGKAGLLSHVWTKPEDRKKGASHLLLDSAMSEFAKCGGQALFLGTEPDGVAHGIYMKRGFNDLNSAGHMAWYANGRKSFEETWFADSDGDVERLGWRHWPTSVPLFLLPGPEVIRCMPLRVFWPSLVEGELLPAIQGELKRHDAGDPPAAVVLRSKRSQAVVGMALWQWDSTWPATCVVDVFCHPAYWPRSGELLAALRLPACEKCIAYCDSTCQEKVMALGTAGFQPIAALPQLVAVDRGRTERVDVMLMEKRHL